MQITTRHKMRAIEAKTAAAFQDAYNEAWAELAEYEPQEHWPTVTTGFCVFLIYDETVKTPTTAKEIYEQRGEVYHCYECPYMGKQRDMRCKHVECATGTTKPLNECCELFYAQLAKGEVQPIRGWE